MGGFKKFILLLVAISVLLPVVDPFFNGQEPFESVLPAEAEEPFVPFDQLAVQGEYQTPFKYAVKVANKSVDGVASAFIISTVIRHLTGKEVKSHLGTFGFMLLGYLTLDLFMPVMGSSSPFVTFLMLLHMSLAGSLLAHFVYAFVLARGRQKNE